LGFLNARPKPSGKQTQVGQIVTGNVKFTKRNTVARIDAVQAEYSPFETLHESDGLIEACRELDVAFVAYGPLGHGWLVDHFPYETPDDFHPDDYRRCGTLIQAGSNGVQCSLLIPF